MLTWILEYFWSLPRGVSPRLEWRHARALSSQTVAAVSRFSSLGSRDLWLTLEAFPRDFPMRLSHRAVPRATVVLVDPRLERPGSAGKTGFPGKENLLDFLKLLQVLSTYDGDLRDPLWWPQERQSPCQLIGETHGIPLPSMPGPKTLGSWCRKVRIPLQC